MAEAAPKIVTYADLEAVPLHLVAEIIDGGLVTHPHPAPRLSIAANSLGHELTGPFQKGRGGPGGWIFMTEPELKLGSNVVVPDLAAWRRERLTALPQTAFLTQAPDWVCEILSPSTETYDRGAKRRIYAEAGVKHLWLLDPRMRLLEAFAHAVDKWLLVGTFADDGQIRVPPFDAVAISLEMLWPYDSVSATATTDQSDRLGD